MAIKYTNLFPFQAPQNLPKLCFWLENLATLATVQGKGEKGLLLKIPAILHLKEIASCQSKPIGFSQQFLHESFCTWVS
jgi:hypothetical protein